MKKSVKEYYKEYYDNLGDKSYRMGVVAKDSSRVFLLKNFIKANTVEGGTVLDVGCGDMHLSTLMPEYQWTGIDLNVDKAQGNAIQHDLEVSPFPLLNETYNTAVCSEVLEHLFDPFLVHTEVHKALKTGGTYIVSTPNYDWIEHRIKDYRQLVFNPNMPHLWEHIRQFTPDSHKAFLEHCGFKVLSQTGADAHYGDFFQPARAYLAHIMWDNFGLKDMKECEIDAMLGMMFPLCSHTIMTIARKE